MQRRPWYERATPENLSWREPNKQSLVALFGYVKKPGTTMRQQKQVVGGSSLVDNY
jgi:hypothetical protein